MNIRTVVRLVGSVVFVCGAAGCQSEMGEKTGSAESAIVGGSVDDTDPAVAALWYADSRGSMGCSGTLITPSVILTAAHCVVPAAANGGPGPVRAGGSFTAYFGSSLASPTITAQIVYVAWDPAFTNNGQPQAHDIAIVGLATRTTVRPAPVNLATPAQNQAMRIAGFGVTSEGGSDYGVKYTGSTAFGPQLLDPHGEIMLSSPVGTSAATVNHGDSGGPAFATTNGVEAVVGVTSGIVPTSAGAFDAYTWAGLRTANASSWLSSWLSTSVSASASNGRFEQGGILSASFSGIRPSPMATNWITLAPAGSALSTYTAWSYLPNASSGTLALTIPVGAPAGSYVVRVFADNGYSLLAESDAFGVARPISTDLAAYASGGDVVVSFAAAAPSSSDWIALAPPASPPSAYVAWQWTNGVGSASAPVANGTRTFSTTALAPGKYVARFMSAAGGIGGESAPFIVSPVPVATDMTSYIGGAAASVSFTAGAASATDWVAIAPFGAPGGSYVEWKWANGIGGAGSPTLSGTLSFDTTTLAPGTYVARFLPAGGYVATGESVPFLVSRVPVTAALSTARVAVTFSGVTPGPTDWVSVSPAGSAPSTYSAWAWTNYGAGLARGTVDIGVGGLPAGRYVARVYPSGSAWPAGESAPFTLTTTPTTTDASSYYAGDVVRVGLTVASPTTTDWVAIAAVGSAPTAYAEWVYTNGASQATLSTVGLAPGVYVARFFPSNGSIPTGESAPFVVAP